MSTGAPLATYRLQLGAALDLTDARALVPYLHELGVSHLYLSPILRARSDSNHGYDVTDPRTIDPRLGTEQTLQRLAETARERGMSIMLDIVPNHMATGSENPYWEDVLRHGPGSPFAAWFDIDWEFSSGRVFIPTLGKRIGTAIDDGEIVLDRADRGFRVRYFDQSFPIDPATIPLVFELAQEPLAASNAEPGRAFRHTMKQLRDLPPRTTTDRTAAGTRSAHAAAALATFDTLCKRSPEVREAVSRALQRFRAAPDRERRLRRLLAAQPYRLAYWRRAAREINYRRFFTVSHLVALRQEDPAVFAVTHDTPLRWLREGTIHGLRVDHVDGLFDPTGYLTKLHHAIVAASPPDGADSVPVYVEKILARDESLPSAWPVAGTTGYDFLNVTEDLFVDPAGHEAMKHDYGRFVGQRHDFASVAVEAKRKILRRHLAGDVARLASRLQRVAHPASPDSPLDRSELSRAIVETVAHLEVYRAYPDAEGSLSPSERTALVRAMARARVGGRAAPHALDCLAATLLPTARTDHVRAPSRIEFARRFQQLCVPAAAKGVEDTAFYVYVPLLSRNEVGGDPQHSPRDAVQEFHDANRRRAAEWPAALLCVSTHDTKRSADLRARLDVLSELPRLWKRCIRRWRRWNRRCATRVRGRYLPDANAEYLLYQTLVGMWPVAPVADAERGGGDPSELVSRLWGYMLKATREAKVHTSWVEPNAEYERALRHFVAALFTAGAERFRADAERLVARLALPGLWNALARTVIHLTAPGVPDVYQGDELWDFSLVDPDNRRPVDFASRRRMLADLNARFDAGPDQRGALLGELVDHPLDGRIKLHAIHRILACRRETEPLFTRGSYHALDAHGPLRRHVVAFVRAHEQHVAITVAPRLVARLGGEGSAPIGDAVWTSTTVAVPQEWRAIRWRSALTGATVLSGPALRLADLLAPLPVAVLVGADAA